MRQLNQRGDTLVEVMIAAAILTVVLTASYNIAGAVFRLGQSAKERTQAANLIQEQAEALRSFRDSHQWNEFRSEVEGGVPFQMTRDSSQWQVEKCNGSPNPFYNAGNCRDQLFTVYINAERDNDDDDPTDNNFNKYRFNIIARWERPGSQPADSNPDSYNHTTITTFLANLDGLVPQESD